MNESIQNKQTNIIQKNNSSSEEQTNSHQEIHDHDNKRVLKWNWRTLITVVCLWFTYLFVNANSSLIGLLLPSEASDKDCSSIITGIIISASPFCVVLFSPFIGYFLSHLGLRFCLNSGLFLIGGTVILQGFLEWMPSGWIFMLFGVLLRMTEGVGLAMFVTAAFTLLPELYPTRVGLCKGLFEVAGGIGYSIGPPLGGVLYENGGFKLPFVTFGGITLIFFFLSLTLVRESKVCATKRLSLKLVLKLVSSMITLTLLFAHVLSQGALSFFSPILQPFLIKEYNLHPLIIGIIFLCASVTYMLMSLIVGPLSDYMGQRYFIITGFFLYGLGFFLIGPADFITSPHLWITCVSYIVIGLGAAFSIVPFYAHILHIAKEKVDQQSEAAAIGILSGIVSFTVSLGQLLGPIIGGTLREYFDFPTSALLVGEVLVAQGFLLLGATVVDKI